VRKVSELAADTVNESAHLVGSRLCFNVAAFSCSWRGDPSHIVESVPKLDIESTRR